MKKLGLLIAMSIVLAAPSVFASTISLVGDKDGFGLSGAPAVPVAGTWTGYGGSFGGSYREVDDPLFTDNWGFWQDGAPMAQPTWVHSYALPAGPGWAKLTINESGMSDDRGPWHVVFNQVTIGQIGEFGSDATQDFRLLTFDVPLNLLTGSDTVSLVYQDQSVEGYAINFAELEIDGASEPVPEPASMLLFGTGLVATRFFRKRR